MYNSIVDIPIASLLKQMTEVPIESHCLGRIINNSIEISKEFNSKFSKDINWISVIMTKLNLNKNLEVENQNEFWKNAKIYQGITIRWKVKALESFLNNQDNQKKILKLLGTLIKLLRGDFNFDQKLEKYHVISINGERIGIGFLKKKNQKALILIDTRRSETVYDEYKELYGFKPITEMKHIKIYNIEYKIKEEKVFDLSEEILVTDNWPSNPEQLTQRDSIFFRNWKENYLSYMINKNSSSIRVLGC